MVKGHVVNTEATKEGVRLQGASLIVDGGKGYDEVGMLLGVSQRTLMRWVKQYRAGERKFSDKLEKGRKRSATLKMQNKVVKQCRGKRFQSCRKVAARLHMTRQSVHRCLQEKGLRPLQTPSKPKLSEKNIAARIAFAEAHRNTDWGKVMFTDEKDFWLFPKASRKNDVVWVANGDEPPPPVDKVRSTQKLHAWGGTTTSGKTKLYFFEGSLNAEKYRTLLQKALKEIKELYYLVAKFFGGKAVLIGTTSTIKVPRQCTRSHPKTHMGGTKNITKTCKKSYLPTNVTKNHYPTK